MQAPPSSGAPPETRVSAPPPNEHLRRQAERALGASVVAAEFTLISVMVGVVLFPLGEAATALLRDQEFEAWPYILAGLVMTLYLWTGVIGHALTIVGWPLDVGRNLVYIVLALVLAVQMHFLHDPVGWFAMSAVSAAIAVLTVWYDARMLQQRLARQVAPHGLAGPPRAGERSAAARPAYAALLSAALTQQRRHVALLPVYAVAVVVPLALVLWLPAVFVEGRGHLVLVAAQTLVTGAALVNTIWAFRGWTGQILGQVVEDLAA